MNKIPTLFVRDDEDRRHVTREVTPGCEWVLAGEGTATRKFDGICVMFDGEAWWARREVKPGKQPPENYVALSTDETTGKTMGWEPEQQSGFYRWIAEARVAAHDARVVLAPGTYELVGPKINQNPEDYPEHWLVPHEHADRYPALNRPLGWDELAVALRALPWEGIVWHHPDGRMAKLKKRDMP